MTYTSNKFIAEKGYMSVFSKTQKLSNKAMRYARLESDISQQDIDDLEQEILKLRPVAMQHTLSLVITLDNALAVLSKL